MAKPFLKNAWHAAAWSYEVNKELLERTIIGEPYFQVCHIILGGQTHCCTRCDYNVQDFGLHTRFSVFWRCS